MSSPTPGVGRNDPCPCGSGQKYKRCCGQVAQRPVATAPDPTEIGNAVALLNKGRLDEAERQSRSLLARFPASGIASKILSIAVARQGRDAMELFRRTCELMPGDAEAHHNLGTELYERRQWPAAVDCLRRATSLDPRNPDYLVDLGNALREAADVAGAVDAYQQALRFDGRHIEAQNNLGNAFLQLRQPDQAIECYRRALALRPSDPLILCNLSNALRLHQLPEQALTAAQRAVAADPGSAAARNFLGLAQLALGRRADALRSFRDALERNPREVAALASLGQALREIGRPAEAADVCRKATEIDPTYPDGYCNLGNAQFDLRLMDEAERSYRAALRLQPQHVAALCGVALVLRQRRQHGEAMASCEAALTIDPACVEALSLLGELRADVGQFAEAETLFNQALKANPRFAFAYSNIAAHRRMTVQDSEWKAGVEALLGQPLPLDHRVSLQFALGKFFDDTKQYDLAFDHFRQANELVRSVSAPYNPAPIAKRIDRVIAECGEDFGRACEPYASNSELPVFIIGMPRSGTSLVEQILASHPDVHGAGEVLFWDAAFDEGHVPAESGRLSAARMGELGNSYLQRLRGMAPHAKRIVDKMPANFLYAGLIHGLFPHARIIHMRRNAVDTCLSIYFQNFFSLGSYANDLGALAQYYREYERITAHWRATLPGECFLEVPYEALTADQEGWTRRLVDFIGLPWDSRCLEFHATERSVITASKWQVRQRISQASTCRWRNYAAHLGPLRDLLEPTELPS